MNDTPLTDKAVIPNADLSDWGHGDSPYVLADFARGLERELNEWRDCADTLAQVLKASWQHDSSDRTASEEALAEYRKLKTTAPSPPSTAP